MTDGRSRRGFLAAAAAVGTSALAGCGGDDEDSGNESDRELALALTHVDGPLHETRVLDLAERDPDWEMAAFEAARDGETHTTQYRTPFFSRPDDPVYVLDGGTYYRLGSVVVDEVATTHPVVRLYGADSTTETGTESSDPVAASDLPESDERGGYVYRSEEAIAASDLLAADGPNRVSYRDTVYAVEVTEERFHEPIYRATAEAVAESPDGMEATLRAKFVDTRVDREGLSREARDALREARGEGYAESHPYSSAYEELLRALAAWAYIDGNIEKDADGRVRGDRLCLYDREYYDCILQFRSSDG
ncbi:hypothetical protein BRC74_05455 [Halobacteriales archaeon QH_7_68_42]|nr:MAG: hypothetical protein BRC74_05455 [Halobacteriales archaeon QH_7_68_42]